MKRTIVTSKIVVSAIFTVCLQLTSTSFAAALDVSQQPLMLVDSVAPNLILTLDDSRSMWRASVPDDNTPRNTRRGKSSSFNPQYYNPDITYEIPKGVSADGAVINYSTTFTAAYHNGFDTTKGSVDLSKEYVVDWYCDHNNMSKCTAYTGTTIGNMLAENPTSDFRAIRTINNTNTTSWYILNEGESIEIEARRINNWSCEARTKKGLLPVPCAFSSNTFTATLVRQPVPAYYYKLKTGCTDTTSENCYELAWVTSTSGPASRPDDRTNFAIWYSFYRDRGLATISAAHLAFFDMSSAVRMTWQGLTGCTTLNGNSDINNCQDNRFREFTNIHKANFYKWLKGFEFVGGTPLRGSMKRAGEFLRTDSDAWAYNPNPVSGSTQLNPQHTCRPSFHILMTDGLWNADTNFANPGRADDKNFDLPDGTSYSNTRAPYADSRTSTLADVAMHYWATDLASGLDNNLKPFIRYESPNAATQYWDPRNNPATWQHMSNYVVGLGLGSSLNNPDLPWIGDTFSGSGYTNLLGGTAWPAAGSDSANNVYDLWHAAINSRGEFFSADSPEDLVSAFTTVLNRMAERTATAAKPGISTSVGDQEANAFAVKNRLFYSSYDSRDWSGDLIRYNTLSFPNGAFEREQGWSARANIPTTRNIKMGGGPAPTKLREFEFTNLSAPHKTVFNTNPDSESGVLDNRGAARVEYLKGTRSGEGDASGQFRRRSWVLGDIVNSSPVVVGAPMYLPYLADKIDGKAGDYYNFYLTNQNRTETVYVGANDGMLHGFNAQTGVETFAFVPNAVIPQLPKLTSQSYKGGAHRYFVDGTPVVRDVRIGTAWRTVLIGTLRAGGKSLFALDITDPANVSLLWEVSNATEGYQNLGYTFAQPEVVRLHSGQWAVLQGNGYDSQNDAASMFVINIATGALIKELVVDDGSAGANGLSSVRGADNNGDGVVDYAYAGDLRGNLWRFDLVKTGTDVSEKPDPFDRSVQGTVASSSFSVAYGGSPLFKATDPSAAEGNRIQSITAVPSIVRHPTRRGYLVLVGTGKYFESRDSAPDTSKTQSVYAIWDRKTRAQSTTSADRSASTRANLQVQTISSELVATFNEGEDNALTREVRMVSETPIQWYTANTTSDQEANDNRVNRWGWRLDLRVDGGAREGEMMVNQMLVRGDSLLLSSLIPNEDPCADGTSGWIYALNASTGARTYHPALDFNRDGRFNAKDRVAGNVASGFKNDSPGGVSLSGDGGIFGADPEPVGFSASPDLDGRQSWQVVPLELEE